MIYVTAVSSIVFLNLDLDSCARRVPVPEGYRPASLPLPLPKPIP
jgi:hypothetical protein